MRHSLRMPVLSLLVIGSLLGLGSLATSTAAAQRAGEETYESPTFGYTLTYDPDEWEVTQEDDDEDDSYDFVTLTDGVSVIRLTGDPDYTARTFDTCLADYVAPLERDPQVDDFEPVTDRGADGEEDDRVWATYSYTFTTDDGDEVDWIRYYECRFLGDGGALGDGLTFVVLHSAAPEDYNDEVGARDDLLAGFDLP